MGGGGQGDWPSSSMDSNSSNPSLFSSASSSTSQSPETDLSTDLSLGLTISRTNSSSFSATRDHSDWPPIKPLLRSTLADKGNHQQQQQATFFVKVYIEGIPIGRKLDLFKHLGYDDLIRTLRCMFRTSNILCQPDLAQVSSNNKTTHVLTYEDKEGDWMMVGDVPWELFLNTVKRLKITRADKC